MIIYIPNSQGHIHSLTVQQICIPAINLCIIAYIFVHTIFWSASMIIIHKKSKCLYTGNTN